MLRELLSEMNSFQGLPAPQSVTDEGDGTLSASYTPDHTHDVMTEYLYIRDMVHITRTDLSGENARQNETAIPATQSVLGRFLQLTGLKSIIIYA